jgi:DNA-binding transcriptional ArsR family regulator
MDPFHPTAEALELTAVLSALGDPARLSIVRTLALEGEQTCGAFELGLSKATRSHHFRVLREAGITQTRRSGTHRYVSLRTEDLEARFPGLLSALLRATPAAPTVGAPG